MSFLTERTPIAQHVRGDYNDGIFIKVARYESRGDPG